MAQTDDRRCSSWPVFREGPNYVVVLDDQPVPKGRHVGSIVHYPDENIFEAWRYLPKQPVLLGTNLRSVSEALALFYRKEQVSKPPPGWLRARFKS